MTREKGVIIKQKKMFQQSGGRCYKQILKCHIYAEMKHSNWLFKVTRLFFNQSYCFMFNFFLNGPSSASF